MVESVENGWERAAPEQTLDGVLTLVGPLVEVGAVPRPGVAVERLAVFDPLDPQARPGTLLVAVGVDPGATAAVALVRAAGRDGVAAVVLREEPDGARRAALSAAAIEAGTALLFRTSWADWGRVIGTLQAGLAAAGGPGHANVPLGDLDRLARVIALQVGGAVTIEDMDSRVLAHYSSSPELDPIRLETVTTGEVPASRQKAMKEAGFFTAIWTSRDVLRRRAHGDVPERLVVGVRAGDKPLGTIWVAATGQAPLPSTAEDALRAAARTAAPHLLHHDSRTTGRDEQLLAAARALLDGHGSAAALAERSGLSAAGRCAVLSLGAAPGGTDGPARTRLESRTHRNCAEAGHVPIVVPSERGILVLLGNLAENQARAEHQVAVVGSLLARRLSDELGTRIRVGLGAVEARLEDAPASARTAELALGGLLFGNSTADCARLDEVADAVALGRLLAALQTVRLPVDTPVARLVAHAEPKGERVLLDTLRAYLDHSREQGRAADALGVARSTFTHRLQKALKISGLDPDDPDARLLAQLQLRLRDG
ncbi:helix-turn-helix domain-containing protein [Kitasatospora sp. NPDC049285]|uniref:PucR family transcriptional regulator n=1 Tax=Kitasatospora sp. NPDC049285 TaxID=3157096 RepID=UPI0034276D7A